MAYGYYPDGLRQSLSITGAVSQLGLQMFAYRTDGLRENLAFSATGAAASFGWSYSSAGRKLAFTDPYSSHTSTYDSYGQLSTDTIAAGTYTIQTRDPEGQPLTYSAFSGTSYDGNSTPSVQSQMFFDESNESQGAVYPGDGSTTEPVGPCSNMLCGGLQFDAYLGILPQLGGNPNAGQTMGSHSDYYVYDNAGRQVGRNINWDLPETCQTTPSGHPATGGGTSTTWQCEISGGWSSARSYDAENHLIGESPVPPVGQQSWEYFCKTVQGPFFGNDSEPGSAAVAPVNEYTYGPAGKVVDDSVAGNSNAQVYWDGNALLLAIYSSTYVLYIGDFAIYSPGTSTPLTVFDRDYSGEVVSQHNSSGHDVWYNPNLYQAQVGVCSQSLTSTKLTWYPAATASYVRFIPSIWMPRTDGIYDGYNMIQGARSYDDLAGQWTAPDAYQGDPEDPVSQNAYMWNRNNPFSYSDPSGYDPGLAGENWLGLTIQTLRNPWGGAFLFWGLMAASPVGSDEVQWMATNEAINRNAATSDAVIGRYPDYEMMSQRFDLHHFHMPSDVYAKKAAQGTAWQANEVWLQKGIDNGWSFLVVAGQKGIGGQLAAEIDMLLRAGYTWSDATHTKLVPPKRHGAL